MRVYCLKNPKEAVEYTTVESFSAQVGFGVVQGLVADGKVDEAVRRLLRWKGKITLDYLEWATGLDMITLSEQLHKLEEEHFCEAIQLPDP